MFGLGKKKSEEPDGFEIPDLKKKEQEARKKGGASWGGGAKSASGMAKSAASSAARTGIQAAGEAVSGAGARGIFSTVLGKAAAVIAATGVGAVGAMALFNRAGLTGGSSKAGPNLGGVASTVRVSKVNNASLNYAARSSKGAIQFAQPKKNEARDQALEQGSPDAAGQTSEADQAANIINDAGSDQTIAQTPRMEHNMSGAKLSSSLGPMGGPRFSDIDPKKLAPKLTPMQSNKTLGKGLAARASRAGGRAFQSRIRRAGGGRAFKSNAMGNLANMKLAGSKSSSFEVMATKASDDFESQITAGGAPPASPDGASSPNSTVGSLKGGGGGDAAVDCGQMQTSKPGNIMVSDGQGGCLEEEGGATDIPWHRWYANALNEADWAIGMLGGAGAATALGFGCAAGDACNGEQTGGGFLGLIPPANYIAAWRLGNSIERNGDRMVACIDPGTGASCGVDFLGKKVQKLGKEIRDWAKGWLAAFAATGGLSSVIHNTFGGAMAMDELNAIKKDIVDYVEKNLGDG